MRSEGLSFYFGGLCLLDHASATATIRNRRQPLASDRDGVTMAVPMASPAKVVLVRGLKRRVASFHVAGVVLCHIPTYAS